MLILFYFALLIGESDLAASVPVGAALSQPVRAKPTAPARRPLDEYPAFVRPVLKYGVGGMVAAWFLVGMYWLCQRRWTQARTLSERHQARRWIFGMLLGVLIALLIVAVGLLLWLRNQHLLTLFLAGPAAVLLPPLLARLLSGANASAHQADATKPSR